MIKGRDMMKYKKSNRESKIKIQENNPIKKKLMMKIT